MPSTVLDLTSDVLADAAGVTYRSLDCMIRDGIIIPIGPALPGSGAQRRYTSTELRVACAVARLNELGARYETLRNVAPLLRAMAEEEWHGTLLVSRSGAIQRTHSPAVTLGEACWALNLDLIAQRATAR